MDVTIRGQNLKVSPRLEAHVQEKLGKLDRYMPNIHDIRVDFSKENTRRGGPVVTAPRPWGSAAG